MQRNDEGRRQLFDRASPPRRERIALAVLLASIAVYLFLAHDLQPYSDCVHWYGFGMNFSEAFTRTKLAYGFPLLIALARFVMGGDYAFLVNIPVFVVFFALIFFLAKRCVPPRFRYAGTAAAFSGFASVFLFMAIDRWILRFLTNPYRDPLSYLLVLAAVLSLNASTRAGGGHLVAAFLSGACLALASSTRETSILMALPFLLFGVASSLHDRTIPFVKTSLTFATGFAIFIIPYLYQTYHTTGGVLIPAQVHRAVGKPASHPSASVPSGEEVRPDERLPAVASPPPGRNRLRIPFKVDYFEDNFPRMKNYMHRKYRVAGLLLMATGFLGGVLYRQPLIYAILAPSLVLHLLLYASYNKLMQRYIFVLDIFAYLLMAAGASLLFHGILCLIHRQGIRRLLAAAAIAALPLSTLALEINCLRGAETRFQIPDMRRLRRDVTALVPEGARIFGDRPLGEIARCFFGRKSDWETDFLKYLLTAPEAAGRRAHSRDPIPPSPLGMTPVEGRTYETYFLYRHHRRSVGEFFDLTPVGKLASRDYSLQEKLEKATIHIDRIEPWKERRLSLPITSSRPGWKTVAVNIDRISQYDRSSLEVSLGEERLSQDLFDGMNYFAVQIGDPALPLSLTLTSDRPLPARPSYATAGIDRPVTMGFNGTAIEDYIQRFPPSIRDAPRTRRPIIRGEGYVDIPTLRPGEDVLYVVREKVALHKGTPRDRYRERVTADGHLIHDDILAAVTGKGPWQKRVLFLDGGKVKSPTTRLAWRISPLSEDSTRPDFELDSLVIHRHRLRAFPDITMAGRQTSLFLRKGFHERESQNGLIYKWTAAHAAVRLLMLPGTGSKQLRVVYLAGNRPQGVAPPSPRFFLNTMPLKGDVSSEELEGGLRRLSFSTTLREGQLRDSRHENILEIRTDAWSPAEEGASRDKRRLGIMLERVALLPL